ncbi:hypothetical protein RS130_17360 [Paraglaciecola aquimarina]|uniref:Uncharacterized protein n=1 Tax=Paraglaciecola aquimarina TaxID=1235557 RepID=A0ABU3SZK2_9ALTE|nr:hypothetical protein [Paraglaciecola aquimarina]MDU0355440.1 hypothetical protein [Paraglaciecola aquimarina]
MHITIDLDDPKPIFAQLIEQIKQAVAADNIALVIHCRQSVNWLMT